MFKNALYQGFIFHKRFFPKIHAFKYNLFNIFVNVDEIEALAKELKYFSHNRVNLISLYDRDYGDKGRAATNIKQSILNILLAEGYEFDGQVWMLTFPRIFGFTFNPLTIYYCVNGASEEIEFVIYEVSNTFKERHNYIYQLDASHEMRPHITDKKMHVSPFYPTKGHYQFSKYVPDEQAFVKVDYFDEGKKQLTASFNGERKPLNDCEILRQSIKTPFMTFKVIGGILYEALRLKLKSIQIFKHSEKHTYQSTKAIDLDINSEKGEVHEG